MSSPARCVRGAARRAVAAAVLGAVLVTSCGGSGDGAQHAAATTSAPASTTTGHDHAGEGGAPGRCPTDESADAAQLAAGSHTMDEGTGSGGHEMGLDAELATCRLRPDDAAHQRDQLAAARTVAEANPTVAAAEQHGFVSPAPAGVHQAPDNVHLVRWDRMDGDFDVAQPEQLLFADEGPEGRLVAVVYYVVGPESRVPAGFAGPKDRWHRHDDICRIDDTIRVLDGSTDRAECTRLGGRFGTEDGWMLHVWVAPGVTNPDGTFAITRPS